MFIKHNNNVKRSLLCKKNIKVTKYTTKYKSVENNKINLIRVLIICMLIIHITS